MTVGNENSGIGEVMSQSEKTQQLQLRKSFYAALLLTTNVPDAETLLMEAIAMAGPCEGDSQAFYAGLLRAATVKRKHFWKGPLRQQPCPSTSLLPRELRCVQKLAMPLRDCFVARMLLGLPLSLCASVMGLKRSEIEELTCAAVLGLAEIAKGDADAANVRHNTSDQPVEAKPLEASLVLAM